ncbi:MAG: rRNA pseudouridine synthase [Chloroflexi bacterium]|nr:rRNA pseudouridine synthase [Chloroflexota bacterium]
MAESSAEANEERLQKFLARAGVASRRSSEELILQGRVAVNKQVITRLGTKVKPDDVVTVDGRPVVVQEKQVYILLNKPRGYVTTVTDPYGRPTVVQLVQAPQRVFPVGRLDVESEGMLLLTNDGDLAHRLMHPRFALEKEYVVLVHPDPSEGDLEQLRQGVLVEGRRTAPAEVQRPGVGAGVSARPGGGASADLTGLPREHAGAWLRIVIHEGRKRQIRHMAEVVGLQVLRLKRVRIGPIRLGDLAPGQSRPLTPDEVKALKESLL